MSNVLREGMRGRREGELRGGMRGGKNGGMRVRKVMRGGMTQ